MDYYSVRLFVDSLSIGSGLSVNGSPKSNKFNNDDASRQLSKLYGGDE